MLARHPADFAEPRHFFSRPAVNFSARYIAQICARAQHRLGGGGMVGDSLPPGGWGEGVGVWSTGTGQAGGGAGLTRGRGCARSHGRAFPFSFSLRARRGLCGLCSFCGKMVFLVPKMARLARKQISPENMISGSGQGLFVSAHGRHLFFCRFGGGIARTADGAECQRNHNGQHNEKQAQSPHTEARGFRILFHVGGV